MTKQFKVTGKRHSDGELVNMVPGGSTVGHAYDEIVITGEVPDHLRQWADNLVTRLKPGGTMRYEQ